MDDDDIFPKCGEHSPLQYLKQDIQPLIDDQNQSTLDKLQLELSELEIFDGTDG